MVLGDRGHIVALASACLLVGCAKTCGVLDADWSHSAVANEVPGIDSAVVRIGMLDAEVLKEMAKNDPDIKSFFGHSQAE